MVALTDSIVERRGLGSRGAVGAGPRLLARLARRSINRVRGYPDLEGLVARGLLLGSSVYVGRGVSIDPWHCWLVSIGDEAVLAPAVMILAHDATTKRRLGYTKVDRVRIGRGAFIGAGSIILPGVTVGDEAIVGAGSVVRHDVPAETIAFGNPAEVVGGVSGYLARHRELMHTRPRYAREGWTVPGRITDSNRRQMLDDLRDGLGYVE